ncbi:restriction endonuclease [Bradyrhizobium diazoefficiens]|nr:restriction endonuclease [Bradyrhizobium diazoefficiens]MBR0810601.1 restriction endonuclease [Bradyrhizobium diazoefficiens]
MAINFSGAAFYDSLIEIVGFKCGVALSRQELIEFLERIGAEEFADYGENQWVRIDSSSYEDLVYGLLKAFGRLEASFSRFPTITMYHKYKNSKRTSRIYSGVMEMWLEWMNRELSHPRDAEQKLIDPTPFLLAVLDKYGRAGFDMANEVIVGTNAAMTASPWSDLRQIEWKTQIELRELFESEGLDVEYGNFIDQRYIDYLHANFSDVDKMHWRKFEQLTAEFLDRSGYRVEIGPGRNDDGVDVRAWSKDAETSRPLVIVQCKRQKATIDKPIIKSLYADVLHESAQSGLLVTTSRLSSGAEHTRVARAYPINVADRVTLREWLVKLREPGVGGQ